MKRNFLYAGLLFAVLGATTAHGQSIFPSTLNATGGTARIGTKEFEWSVGEIALVSTFTTSSIVVTQGVLQTNFGPKVTEVPGTTNLGDYLQIFPNPTSDAINIRYNAANDGVIEIRFIDMAGRLISAQKSDVKQGANNQKIDIAHLAAATYMLEVYVTSTGGKTEATAYKIQKLQ